MFARRSFLQGAGLALLLTACGGSGSRSAARPRTVSGASPSLGTSAAAVGRSRTLTGYAFGATHQDVTLFDAGARQALRTQPLGATVTWLSNEQRFWDGHYIWTYDFPKNQVQAIAIDPQAVSVVRTIAAGGPGPAHSLMLTPDLKTAWVNIAGANELAMIDLASGQVSARVKTGAFPWDLHFTPDGRFGFTPERDQDTVSKIDLAAHTIVKTHRFPAGSKPWMLRVSPDGKEVWVQTAGANTNVVLDSATMAVLHTTPTGKQPVQSAFQPAGRYGLVMQFDDSFVLVLDHSGKEVKRIEVGHPQANASFTPDGAFAFVSIPAANEVAVIDMAQLTVVARIATAAQPMGLVLL